MIKQITKPGIYVCIVYYPLIEKSSYGVLEYRCPFCHNYLMKKFVRAKDRYEFHHCLDPKCPYVYMPGKVAKILEIARRADNLTVISPGEPPQWGSQGRLRQIDLPDNHIITNYY